MDMDRAVKAALDQAVYQNSVMTAGQQLQLTSAVLRSVALSAIGGQHVPDLEARVAHRLGRRGAVAPSSATAGIELALRCLPVRRPGWGVLVPEVCWASVATAVHHAGGTVHIAPVTRDLTPHREQIESLLGPSITVVVLAHLRGRPAADTTRIAAELAARGVVLLEDCAQAWAVTVDGRPAGSYDTIAVFSTETWKLIATGEGGIVAADDPDLLQTLRAASGDTRSPTAESNPWRESCRMSELAAASALPQLRGLDAPRFVVLATRNGHDAIVRHPIRFRMDDLRRMLNDWDFIGVRDFCVLDDEYDCLIGPLLTRLAAGATTDEITIFLRNQITSHFGLDPAGMDVAGFAARTVTWWRDSPPDPRPAPRDTSE